jgi:hypothetical protein
MSFVAQHRTDCTECDSPILPGQLASFAYSKYHHVVCPEARPPAAVCPTCFVELPVTGVCDDCS